MQLKWLIFRGSLVLTLSCFPVPAQAISNLLMGVIFLGGMTVGTIIAAIDRTHELAKFDAHSFLSSLPRLTICRDHPNGRERNRERAKYLEERREKIEAHQEGWLEAEQEARIEEEMSQELSEEDYHMPLCKPASLSKPSPLSATENQIEDKKASAFTRNEQNRKKRANALQLELLEPMFMP